MKKLMTFVLALICMLGLVGGGDAEQEQAATYSFRGEHTYFTISNGSIILSDTEEAFDGGDLQITQPDKFEAVASYSTTFYTLIDGERRIILSNRVSDQTGSSVNFAGDLGAGSVSGQGILIGGKVESIDTLKENLWFELETTDLSGEENVYQIQLTF